MKFESHQKKLALFSLSLLITLILSWSLAIKKTWNNYRDLKTISTELDNMDISDRMVRELEQQLAKTSLLQNAEADSSQSKLIFKKISDLIDLTGNIKIMQFPEVHRYMLNEYQVETMKLELEGDFFNLLRLIYRMENEHSIGEMASASFKIVKDYKQNKEYLRLIIFIQNLHK